MKGTRPRIGVDLHVLEGLHQGSRTYAFQLFSRVAAHAPEMDFRFFVDTARWDASYAEVFSAPNAEVIPMPRRNSVQRLTLQLPALVKEHRVDLLHTQYICPPILDADTAVTIHDLLIEEFPQYFEKILLIRSKILFRLSATRSKLVFTGCDYSRQKLEQLYHVPPEKITLLYSAASDVFTPGDEGAAEVRALGVTPGEYLLTVGRLEPRKNHAGLLRAMARLSEPRPKLVIVGQRDFGFDEIFRLRKELGLEQDVVMLEKIQDKLLPALYRNARLFVYPTFAEGFGLPVVEAMASGTPFITSNSTSLPEVAGGAGILVDPHSDAEIAAAIEAVLGDPALAARMRADGLRRAGDFSWNRTAEVLAGAYRRHFFKD